MPQKARRQKKSVNSGSTVLNDNLLTASEKSGAADLPKGEKLAAKPRKTAVEQSGQEAAKPRKTAVEQSGQGAAKPRKTAVEQSGQEAAKPRKTAVEQTEENSISCKTPQVMRLISDDNFGNPVIVAGKSRIPSRLRGREPLSRVLKRQMNGEPLEPGEAEVVNLTDIAVRYEAPLILDRFNACSCEKCVKVFSEQILLKVSARYARITKLNRDARSRELNSRLEPVLKIVQIAMIRELIGCKKRVFHNE